MECSNCCSRSPGKVAATFASTDSAARANKTVILEFMVADVDAEFARLKDQVEVVHEPKDLPWGNRTVQFCDPEGASVALYTPVTEAAKRRFSNR